MSAYTMYKFTNLIVVGYISTNISAEVQIMYATLGREIIAFLIRGIIQGGPMKLHEVCSSSAKVKMITLLR